MASRALDVYGLVWHTLQAPVLADLAANEIVIKHGMYHFAKIDKDAFCKALLADATSGIHRPIFEIVHADRPCRLYFDVEMDDTCVPDDANQRAWLCRVLGHIDAAIFKAGYTTMFDPVIMNDSRQKSDTLFKRSFHLIYEISFTNNHEQMKDFVMKEVLPLIKDDACMQWGTGKFAIDFAVYSKFRAMRTWHSTKGDTVWQNGEGTAFKLWDVEGWEELQVTNSIGVNASLIATVDPQKIVPLRVMAENPSMRVKRTHSSVMVPTLFTEPASEEDKAYVRKTISHFPSASWQGHASALNIVMSVSTVFQRNQEGMELLVNSSSKHRPKKMLDEDYKWISVAYQRANGSRGIGGYKCDLEAVAPLVFRRIDDEEDAADAALFDEGKNDEPVLPLRNKPLVHLPDKFDFSVVLEMAKSFNEQHRDKCCGGKIVKNKHRSLIQKAEQKLFQDITFYLNNWFMIITHSGTPVTMEKHVNHFVDCKNVARSHLDHVTRTPRDLASVYANRTISLCHLKKDVCVVGDVWYKNIHRREFERIDFFPEGNHCTVFNTFNGLKITRAMSKQDDYAAAIFQAHILDIWCSGNKGQAEYTVKTFASLLQRPGKKLGVTIVLVGGHGAGKSILINMFGNDLLGSDYYMSVSSLHNVTGQFCTERAKTNLLTFLDECTYSGSKDEANKLKYLITEEKRVIETKYVNAIHIQNHSNFIIASNSDSAVFVEETDRRYCCLEVNNKYAGVKNEESKAYFDALGGISREGLAHFLYSVDLEGFEADQIPDGAYRNYQKTINFDAAKSFIHKSLDRRFWVSVGEGDQIEKDNMLAAYTIYAETRNFRGKPVASEASFFKTLYALTGYTSSRLRVDGDRQHFIHISPWEEARAAFKIAINAPSFCFSDEQPY